MLNFAQSNFGEARNRWLSRASLIGVLSAVGVLSGWVPGLSKDFSTVVFETTAQAQSSSQVKKYARAVLDMEPLRQSSYREFTRLTGGNMPTEACRRGGLPNDVEYVCKRFFSRSAEIIEKNGLSIAEFNSITSKLQRDGSLKQRIQQELMRQQ